MSKIHILEGQGGGNYRAVIHFATPVAQNSANLNYSEVLVAAGRTKSVLATGAAAYQISAADLALLQAGSLVEFEMQLPAESGGTGAVPLLAALNDMVDRRITQYTAELQATYKHYGRAVA